jgi:hypothetical protein
MTKTPETYQEALDRVFLMGAGSTGTWDLSDNDVAALAMVLKRLDQLENLVNGLAGLATNAFFERIEIHADIDEGGLWSVEIPGDSHVNSFTAYNLVEAIELAIKNQPDAPIQSGQFRRAPTEECGVVYTDDKPLRED